MLSAILNANHYQKLLPYRHNIGQKYPEIKLFTSWYFNISSYISWLQSNSNQNESKGNSTYIYLKLKSLWNAELSRIISMN